jgi:predicted ATP-grasp superfamily ATP-dependent carboligase
MPHILLGKKIDWEENIKSRLSHRFTVSFPDLLQGFNANDYDVIVPLTCQEIDYLNSYYPEFSLQKYLAPSPELLNTTNDKLLFNNFLERHGYRNNLPGPITAAPFIIKKRIDEWGINSRIVFPGETIKFNPHEYIAQAFVPGNTEFATHFLAKKGEIFYHSSRKYTFPHSMHVKGRDCQPETTSIIETEHLDLFQAIIRDLNFTGFACINYKILDGVVIIFEINPRMGASLVEPIDTAMESYVNCLERIPGSQKMYI